MSYCLNAMRKLATAAVAFCVAVFLSHYLIPRAALPYTAAVAAVLTAGAVAFKGNIRFRIVLITLAGAAGFVWSFIFFGIFILPQENETGRTTEITAVVSDHCVQYENYSCITVRVFRASGPPVKARLVSYAHDLTAPLPGDIVETTIKLLPATKRFGADTDIYISDGVFLVGTVTSEVRITGKSVWAALYFPKTAARAVKNMTERCAPGDVSGFLTGLLTGDKSGLYSERSLSDAMAKTGLMHVTAVSGLHIAFLTGFVRSALGRRKQAAAVGIPLIVFFVLMTGSQASAIRAGFMQICLLAAPLIRRENDSLTSLSAVAALLLIINPQAVGSIGFQLSFSAMTGVVLVTPRIYDSLTGLAADKNIFTGYAAPAARFAINCFSGSVGASVFTVPLIAAHFGYISVYSIIVNILSLWAVSLCFVLGYAMCILGFLLPAAGVSAGYVTAFFARYVLFVAKSFANLPFSAVYTTNNFASAWLILTYVLLIITYASALGRKTSFRPVLPLCLSVCVLCISLITVTEIYKKGATITVLDVGQGAGMAVFSGADTVLIDCGGRGSVKSAQAVASDYLSGKGRRGVDLFILTHFHDDHASGAADLISITKVKRLAIPAPTAGEEKIFEEIYNAAVINGVDVYYIEEDTLISLGASEFQIMAPIGTNDANERGLIILGSFGEFDFLVTGDAPSSVERRLIIRNDLPKLELLAAGHHGSNYSTSKELLDVTSPAITVISVGYNSYGHPSDEMLKRLYDAGSEVYRTDMHGNVTIRIG
ncbi:MAG: DNA internalization-related competence protein ComEC/Rec2 [Oscillospiraceae bacterium]|nr:DNA internalization-related competence protein ComEC/Rec2 [Oscillospiraceae bacterium]